eukprot:70972_1
MHLNLFFLLIIICCCNGKNEYDTSDNDCPRIRRPWHKLTTNERDLYISGLLELRKRGNGDINLDEFINIASVHVDEYATITHSASSYLFWHGYLTYELESRIRNLGNKYKCFGMPYWEFTLENGRETDPFIIHTGLGGNGNPNNHWNVNEYSWNKTSHQYWIPDNCYAENDKYPICSLKRAINPDFTMPSAQAFGKGIINNPKFIDFTQWYTSNGNKPGNPIRLFYDPIFEPMFSAPERITSYEPIWYLFHSMVQYHQAIWTDCNQYDLIDINDLDNYPDAYTAFCNDRACTDIRYPMQWMGMELDDTMYFGGALKNKSWSYIYKNELSVRKLYYLNKWNIIYDLDNGDGFYKDSGLAEYCKGKLNDEWFILNEYLDEEKIEKDEMFSTHLSDNQLLGVVMVIFIGVSLCVHYMYWFKNTKDINGEKHYYYGSVSTSSV